MKLFSPLKITAALLLLSLTPFAQASHDISVSIITDNNHRLPTYSVKSRGTTYRSYLQAEKGKRYGIRVKNHTNSRIGLVIAVDGRNIITGKKSYLRKTEKMYILQPYASATYDGWRTAKNAVNRFYFTDAGDSYAEAFSDDTAMGVIAIAAFEEKHRHRPTQSYSRSSQKAAPSAARGRSHSKMAADEAGTGYGERENSPSVRVEFTPRRYPLEKVIYKYEWRKTLCRKGIIRCRRETTHHQNRFWPDDDDFAPPPPNHYRHW